MSREILDLPPPPFDRQLPYGPLPLQFGELRLPPTAPPHPLAILIHGGFWRVRYDVRHLGHLATALTAEGIATWSIEYRRIGDSGGGWPGTFLDVAAAADHARTLAPIHGLDLGRVIAVGHSAGGQLACWLAARSRIAVGSPVRVGDPLPLHGALSLAGVVDLRAAWELGLSDQVVEQLLDGDPDTVPERYAAASPYDLLPLGTRQILMHGTDDDIVPFEMSERYAARAQEAGDRADLVTLQGMGHFEPIDPRSVAWPAVRDSARTLLA
jgi:acetyl esterase/lipase